jgi:catecholate siderophore receptor
VREIYKQQSPVKHLAKHLVRQGLPTGALLVGLASPLALADGEPAPKAPADKADVQLAPVEVKADKSVDPKGTADTYNAQVTTVGRTAQAVKDVPQSLTAVTRKLMDDRDATTLKDALKNAPGISYNSSEGGNSGDVIVIRGFSAKYDLFLDNFRDSAKYNRDTFDLDRVEVLRGPASMVYGRGSTGGVINQVSKTPFVSDRKSIDLTLGSNAFKRVESDLSAELGDSSALRVNLMKQEAGSFRDGAEMNRWGVAPSVGFGIGTTTEVVASYVHYQEHNTPDYGVPIYTQSASQPKGTNQPIDYTHNFYGLTAVDREDNRNDVLSLTVHHSFGNGLTLNNATRVARFEADMRATSPSLNTSGTGGLLSDATLVNRARKLILRDQRLYSNVTDFTAKFDTAGLHHDVLAGLELTREKLVTTSRAQVCKNLPAANMVHPDPNAAVDCPEPTATGYGDVKGDTGALYVQDLLTVAPNWKVLLGGRFDHFKADADSRKLDGSLASDFSRTDNIWSSRAGLIWQPSDSQSWYLSYGTSFNPTAEAYSVDLPGTNTPPEKNENYEFGLRWDPLDGLSVNTALFRTVKLNERQSDIENPGTPSQSYLESGRRHTSGVEISVNGQVTKALQVFGSYTYMNAKIDSSTRKNPLSPTGTDSGMIPINTPHYTSSIWLSYAVNKELTLGLGENAQGKRYTTTANTVALPAYVEYDASAEWQRREYSIKLNVFNLTDRRYFDSYQESKAVPGMARSARITFGYKFW